MSVAVMARVWQIPDMQPSIKMVLLKLADNADEVKLECYPSVPTMARLCCLSERTVQACLKELEVEGWISREMQPGRATIYRLHLDRTPAIPALVQNLHRRKSPQKTPAKSAPPPPQSAAIPQTPYIAEPSVEPSEEPSGSGSAPPRAPSAVGTRLPDDWHLPDEWRMAAMTRGATADQVEHEAEKFALYWTSVPGTKARKVNWRSTWLIWIIKSLEGKADAQPRTLAAAHNDYRSPSRRAHDATLAGFAKLGERLDAERGYGPCHQGDTGPDSGRASGTAGL